MSKEQERTPAWIGIGVVICAALTLYWMFTYSGPFRWMVEWQLENWEGYYKKWTFVVLYLLTFAIWAIVFGIGSKFTGNQSNPAIKGKPSSVSPTTGQRVSESRCPAWAFFFAAIAVAGGVYNYYTSWTAGELMSLNVKAIEDGGIPESKWLDLAGRLRPDDAMAMERDENDNLAKYYAPFVSTNWRTGSAVHVFVVARASKFETLPENGVIRGRLTSGGLPGPLREAFMRANRGPYRDYHILDAEFDPQKSSKAGRVFFIAAGGLIALGAAIWFIRIRMGREGS